MSDISFYPVLRRSSARRLSMALSCTNALRMMMACLSDSRACLCCGRPSGSLVCGDCLSSRLYDFDLDCTSRCARCGRPLLSENDYCRSCRNEDGSVRPAPWDRCIPLHSYRLWAKDFMFSWKTKALRELSPVIASVYERVLDRLDVKGRLIIVPVPARSNKIRVKGWDQMQDVCLFLEEKGFDVVPLLRRVASCEQKKLDKRDRMDAASTSYAVDEDALSSLCRRGLQNAEAVVLDDVITTGATVSACSKALKNAGLRKVTVMSIFIVD